MSTIPSGIEVPKVLNIYFEGSKMPSEKESFDKEKSLHFKAHITTDYQYYKETIVQAKILERTGEWGFAKREYFRAFKLFRVEPLQAFLIFSNL
jgi:hypothetical protein